MKNHLTDLVDHARNPKKLFGDYDFKSLANLSDKEILQEVEDLKMGTKYDTIVGGCFLELPAKLAFLCGALWVDPITGKQSRVQLLDRTLTPILSFSHISAGTRGTTWRPDVDFLGMTTDLPADIYLLGTAKLDKKGDAGMDIQKSEAFQFRNMKHVPQSNIRMIAIRGSLRKQKITQFAESWSLTDENGNPSLIIKYLRYFLNELEQCGWDLIKLEQKYHNKVLPPHKPKDPIQECLVREIIEKFKDYDTVGLHVIMRLLGKSHASMLAAKRMGCKRITILNPFPSTIHEQWENIPKNCGGWQDEGYKVFSSRKDDNTKKNHGPQVVLGKHDKFVNIMSYHLMKVGKRDGAISDFMLHSHPDIYDVKQDLLIQDEIQVHANTDQTIKYVEKIKRQKTLLLTGTMDKLIATGYINPSQVISFGYEDCIMAKRVGEMLKKGEDPRTLGWMWYEKIQKVIDEGIDPSWSWNMFNNRWCPELEIYINDTDKDLREYLAENGLSNQEESTTNLFTKSPDGTYGRLKRLLIIQLGAETKDTKLHYPNRLFSDIDADYLGLACIYTSQVANYHAAICLTLLEIIEEDKQRFGANAKILSPICNFEGYIKSFSSYIKDPDDRFARKMMEFEKENVGHPSMAVLCQIGAVGITLNKLRRILWLKDINNWPNFMQCAFRVMTPAKKDNEVGLEYLRKVVAYTSGISVTLAWRRHIACKNPKTLKDLENEIENFTKVYPIYIDGKRLDVSMINKMMANIYAYKPERISSWFALDFPVDDYFDSSNESSKAPGFKSSKAQVGDKSKGKRGRVPDNEFDNDDGRSGGADPEEIDYRTVNKARRFFVNTIFIALWHSLRDPSILDISSFENVISRFTDEDKKMFAEESGGLSFDEVKLHYWDKVLKNVDAADRLKNYWICRCEERKKGLPISKVLERDDADLRQYGDISTPEQIVTEMHNKLHQPPLINGEVLDFCCGRGGFLVDIVARKIKGKLNMGYDMTTAKAFAAKTTYGMDIRLKNVVMTREVVIQLVGKENESIVIDRIQKGDSLNYDWKMKKFDIIPLNPPYQAPQTVRNDKGISGGGDTLWDKSIVMATSLLKDGGYLCAVHPSGWRGLGKSVNKVRAALANGQLHYLEPHNADDGLKTFGVTTRYDWYVWQNTPPTKPTTIRGEDGKMWEIDLREWQFIPNGKFDEISKLVAKKGEPKVEVLHSYSDYETRKEWMSKERTDKFKYPRVYYVDKQGNPTLWWSSINNRGHDVPGVIFASGVIKSVGYMVDAKGEYGMTQFAKKIVDVPENLPLIAKAMNSDRFRAIMEMCVVAQTELNKDILATFRKDFWKEFVTDVEAKA